jgi:ribosomal protein S12 methylthiotransferase accessory factor
VNAPPATSSEPRTSPAPPLRVGGREYRAIKHFWKGTQRVISPAETIERVRPHFARLGLTRLANVTGLDHIGIPTVLSVRPNGPSLSADAGKGFTVEAAIASAAMECVERYHAETACPPEFRASYERVAAEHAVVPFARLMRVRAAQFTPRLALHWTLGRDLMREREVAVPTMWVRLDKSKREAVPLPFSSDSNGLSAGNDLLEAVSGGLLECIERDAITCCRLAWGHGDPPPRVRLETIEHAETRELLERCQRAEVAVILFDCTVDTDVPVYMAYLYDKVMRHVGLYHGCGAHLDPGIAMVRAITEAVQGRLIYIAGSRDDFFRHADLRWKLSDDAATVREIEAMPATLDARAQPSLSTPTFEGDVDVVLQRLRAAGIDQVVLFELTQPGFEVAAVRIVVPLLEAPESDFCVPGERARAFVRRRRQARESTTQ